MYLKGNLPNHTQRNKIVRCPRYIREYGVAGEEYITYFLHQIDLMTVCVHREVLLK